MNQATIRTLCRYNAFANGMLLDTVAALEAVDLDAPSPSHDSIRNLLRHMLMVEVAYLRAAQQQPFDRDAIPADAAGIIAALRALPAEQLAFLDSADDDALAETRTWFGITLPLNQLLLQSALHTIQHRSEIGLLLGQQGHEMPDLDILRYFILESGQQWPW